MSPHIWKTAKLINWIDTFLNLSLDCKLYHYSVTVFHLLQYHILLQTKIWKLLFLKQNIPFQLAFLRRHRASVERVVSFLKIRLCILQCCSWCWPLKTIIQTRMPGTEPSWLWALCPLQESALEVEEMWWKSMELPLSLSSMNDFSLQDWTSKKW